MARILASASEASPPHYLSTSLTVSTSSLGNAAWSFRMLISCMMFIRACTKEYKVQVLASA